MMMIVHWCTKDIQCALQTWTFCLLASIPKIFVRKKNQSDKGQTQWQYAVEMMNCVRNFWNHDWPMCLQIIICWLRSSLIAQLLDIGLTMIYWRLILSDIFNVCCLFFLTYVYIKSLAIQSLFSIGSQFQALRDYSMGCITCVCQVSCKLCAPHNHMLWNVLLLFSWMRKFIRP